MSDPANPPTFIEDEFLRVGDVDFYCGMFVWDPPPGRLAVMKDRKLVERYIALGQEIRPSIIVELGIQQGGSTALLHELIHPDKLIAIEIESHPAPGLLAYVHQHGLSAVVRPYYGVDQSDRTRLVEILAQEIGDRSIDLIIDDASHLYEETLASFETLFPRLAPDGLFVIEDWNGGHLIDDLIEHARHDTTRTDQAEIEQRLADLEAQKLAKTGAMPSSLVKLIVQLVVARASSGDVIRDLTINEHWAIVRRGSEPLDPHTFRLGDHLNDHSGFSVERDK